MPNISGHNVECIEAGNKIIVGGADVDALHKTLRPLTKDESILSQPSHGQLTFDHDKLAEIAKIFGDPTLKQLVWDLTVAGQTEAHTEKLRKASQKRKPEVVATPNIDISLP